MNGESRRWLIAGIILLAMLILAAGTVLIYAFFFRPFFGTALGPFGWNYESNGERIYFTGTSQTGPPITAEMQAGMPMGRRLPGRMACVSCHGEDGRGGTVRMMMSTFEAPDIRYKNLTGEDHEGGHEEHPPYTDETLRRAITQGIDPSGEPLEWVMPRWEMSEEQLNDLFEYLKTFE